MRYQTALFAIAALAMTGVAQADTTSTVPDATQKSISGLYALTCTAVQEPTDKNIDAAFATFAPDYVAIDAKGKQHKRDEIVASIRMQLKAIEADDCTNAFDSITAPDASTLVIVDTMHVTGTVKAQDGKHAIDSTSKSSDTWKLAGGTWQETQSKVLRDLVKVDGNVVEDSGGN